MQFGTSRVLKKGKIGENCLDFVPSLQPFLGENRVFQHPASVLSPKLVDKIVSVISPFGKGGVRGILNLPTGKSLSVSFRTSFRTSPFTKGRGNSQLIYGTRFQHSKAKQTRFFADPQNDK